MTPQETLAYHVTGAIERGEKEAITEQAPKQLVFFVEMTDTFGGEANYSWAHRFLVTASSFQGAIRKVTRKTGYYARKVMDTGDMAQYKVPGACITYFVNWTDEEERERLVANYSRIETL